MQRMPGDEYGGGNSQWSAYRVLIVGRLKGSHLNGKEGVVIRPDPATATYKPGRVINTRRYIVRLLDNDEEERSIKHGNLEPLAVHLRLKGLSKDELNGQTGALVGQSEASAAERFIVRLDDGGRELSVKIGNVEKIER